MNVLITGGTGFIGTRLSGLILDRGHSVISLSTATKQGPVGHKHCRHITADTSRKGAWQKELRDVDAVINLAGRTIFKRWNAAYKKEIYDSRILTTRNIVEAIPPGSSTVLCSASAIGYYGDRGDELLPEDAGLGHGFLADVGKDWEEEAFQAIEKGIRVATMRFGIALGRDGGAMAKMLPAFRLFVGGPLGDGRQWFSWIHIDDLTAAILFIIENAAMSGPFNFSSPNPVRNQELAKTIGKTVARPSFMPAPKILIRLAMGELGSTLLDSQRVIPANLLKAGFRFQYPDLASAVRQIVE